MRPETRCTNDGRCGTFCDHIEARVLNNLSRAIEAALHVYSSATALSVCPAARRALHQNGVVT